MGTLTANVPRLQEYCPHKLPTSCRLTSIPECCACADERAHAAAYRQYVDGVGYVLVGSRWQRYCWFCKEFWENRVRASGLSLAQTRIPDRPDQTAFLDRWYEFHQGYRTITQADGSEARIAVVGEDMRDVSPGVMPRTAEEMREGRAHSAFDLGTPVISHSAAPVAETGPSLDQTLDDLFETAAAEQDESVAAVAANNNIHAQAMSVDTNRIVARTQQSARRITALRRELYRMRNGIERVVDGLRELGAIPPDATETTERLGNIGRALENIDGDSQQQARMAIAAADELVRTAGATNTDNALVGLPARVQEARQRAHDARRTRDQAALELEHADQEMQSSQQTLQRLQREQRTMDNFTRVFGTREDIAAQGEAYESPIGGLFNAAWDRFRAAEQTRQEERTLRRALADEQAVGGEENMRRLAEIQAMEPDVWGVRQRRPVRERQPTQAIRHTDTGDTTRLMEMARDEVFNGQQPAPLSREERAAEVRESARQLTAIRTRLEQQRARMEVAHELEGLPPSPRDPNPQRAYVLTYNNMRRDIRFLICRAANGLARPQGSDVDHEFYDEIGRLTMHFHVHDEMELPPQLLERIFAEDHIIWQLGLPAEWFARSARQGQRLTMTADPTSDGREEQRQNIEAMAEAFQQSARVRRQSTLDPRAQLTMLYRLQAGERSEEHRRILWDMLNQRETVTIAREVLQEQADDYTPIRATVEALNDARQAAARSGQYSRADLETRRQETRDDGRRFDLNSDSDPSLLRMPQLSLNAQMQRSPGDSNQNMFDAESEYQQEDAAGLDALDTGRPDPKEDEEMTMVLDCRICFSQIADIACLPCGHLVMCKWCSDQHSPCFRQDATRPRRPARCPICRKGIKQKVRIIRA